MSWQWRGSVRQHNTKKNEQWQLPYGIGIDRADNGWCEMHQPLPVVIIFKFPKYVTQRIPVFEWWLIDEEAAAVVRRIFRLTIEGCGPYEIARIQELTPETLREFIDKIVVYHREQIGGQTVQKVEIHYKMIGYVELPHMSRVAEQCISRPLGREETGRGA